MELAARRHGAIAGRSVIDNPVQVQRLLAQLQAALPVQTRATPELTAMLKAQNISNASSAAAITAVSYAGDEGGIVCRLRNPGKRECRPCFHYPPTLRPKITDDARDHSLSKAPREAPQTADVLKKPNVHTTTQRLHRF